MTELKTAKTEKSDYNLKDQGILILNEDVGESMATKVIEFILEHNIRKVVPFMQFVISSYGGYTKDAYAIIDMMNGSKIPIRTIGLGIIASSGFMIFINGQKGYRTLTPRTMILSHQFSAGTWGKEHELFSSIKRFELQTQVMLAHYRDCTGLSDEVIREKLLPPTDVWLSADEAKALNCCDHVEKCL